MRSRVLRPFSVEYKSKSKKPSPPAPSLWGDVVFEESRQSLSLDPAPVTVAPDIAPAYSPPKPARVLPDLRIAEADQPVEEERPKRGRPRQSGDLVAVGASRRGRKAGSTAPSLRSAAEQALVAADAAFVPPVTDAGRVLPQDAKPTLASSRLRRRRLRPMQAGGLPRGERWKRRLPKVCW